MPRPSTPPLGLAAACLAVAFGVGLPAFSFSSTALAADPQQPTFPPPEEDNGIERPPAPDQRTGHIYFSPTVSAVGPVGYYAANVTTQSIAGVGWDVGAILGVGIGRYSVLQVYGNRTAYSSPIGCSVVGCLGTGYAVGLGVAYHLVQGIAFDPWGSFGMGYRASGFQVAAPTAVTVDGTMYAANHLVPQLYQGFDVARIAFGGDFYPVPWFGFGPFVEADVGTNLHRPAPLITLPPNIIEGPRVYGFFSAGFRISFDPMRRGSLPRTPAAPAAPSTTGSVTTGSSPGM